MSLSLRDSEGNNHSENHNITQLRSEAVNEMALLLSEIYTFSLDVA